MGAVDNVTDNCWPITMLKKYCAYYKLLSTVRFEDRFGCDWRQSRRQLASLDISEPSVINVITL